MARLAGLCSSRFSTLYRTLFGCSPGDDRIAAHVERAAFLLREHPLRVGEVAAACGFRERFAFQPVFPSANGRPAKRRARLGSGVREKFSEAITNHRLIA